MTWVIGDGNQQNCDLKEGMGEEELAKDLNNGLRGVRSETLKRVVLAATEPVTMSPRDHAIIMTTLCVIEREIV